MNLKGTPLAFRIPARPPSSARRRSGGLLLIECLVYISLVMILVGLSLAAFYRAFEHSSRLSQAGNHMIRVLEAGESWRAEIRGALAPPRLETEDGLAVLQVPGPNGPTSFAFFDQAVWRRPGGAGSWQPFLAQVKATRFEQVSRTRVEAWRWELQLESGHPQAALAPLFTFQAVPGFGAKP